MAAGLRIFIGMILLLIYALIKKRPNTVQGPMMYKMMALGIIMFGIPWACLFWGEQFVPPGIASIINATVPIFILIMSWALLPEEQPTIPTSLGALLGFVGMICVFSPSVDIQPAQLQTKMGIISIFVMSVSYALGGVLMKKLAKGQDMLWVFVFQALSSSVFLAVLSIVKGEKIVNQSMLPESSLGIFYLALCSTAIASLLYYHLIFAWGTLKASAVTYLVPFVAVIIDIVALHTYPKKNEYIGGGLIMVGILLIHWSKTKNLHRLIYRKKDPTQPA